VRRTEETIAELGGSVRRDGKTDLLKDFISNRTRRKFSAYLVAKEGKVGFEFEKKVAKPKAPAKKKAEAAT